MSKINVRPTKCPNTPTQNLRTAQPGFVGHSEISGDLWIKTEGGAIWINSIGRTIRFYFYEERSLPNCQLAPCDLDIQYSII